MRALVAALSLAIAPLAAGDSVWPKNPEARPRWFNDLKARRVGDVVTVLIREESTATTDLSESHSKDTKATASVAELRLPGLINKPKPDAADDEKGLPKVDWKSSRTYDAKAKAESKEKLEVRVAAVVVERLPNGNLVIEGRREIRHDRDARFIHVCGVVRPADISADNTVLSERLANAKITYEGAGPAARTKNKGWFACVVDFLWPF